MVRPSGCGCASGGDDDAVLLMTDCVDAQGRKG